MSKFMPLLGVGKSFAVPGNDGVLAGSLSVISAVVSANLTVGGTMARVDHLNETKVDASGTLDTASSAFTPQSNSLVVAVIAIVNQSATLGTGTTLSGGSLTWTRSVTVGIENVSGSGYSELLEIWTAPVTSAASMSITITNGATASDSVLYWQVMSFTNANATQNGGTVANNNIGSTGTGAMTLSASPLTKDVTVAARHFFPIGSVDPTATPGAGWTEVYDQTGTNGYGGLETQVRGSSTSTAVAWTEINVEAVGLLGAVGALGAAVVIKAV